MVFPHFLDFRKRSLVIAELFGLAGLLQTADSACKGSLDAGKVRAQQRPALGKQLRRGGWLPRRERGHGSLLRAQARIEKMPVLRQRLALDQKAVPGQILPQRLPGALAKKFDQTVFGAVEAPGSNFDTLKACPAQTILTNA